jgi:hypothetical protein
MLPGLSSATIMNRSLFLVTCTALLGACGTSSPTTDSATMATVSSVAHLEMTGGH